MPEVDPRRLAREAALQMLYAVEMGGQSANDVERWYVTAHPMQPSVRELAGKLLDTVTSEREQIESLIDRHARGWRFKRMSPIDRSVLKLATAELIRGRKSAPVPVVISEALHLARKFSSPDAVTFVNGVLDAIARDLKEAER